MILAVLKVVVQNEDIKAVTLEYYSEDINARPNLEERETLESAVRILLTAKHLILVRFKIMQNIVVLDAQMLYDAVMQSRAMELDFEFSMSIQNIPFLLLVAQTHPTLQRLYCYFQDRRLVANHFEKKMSWQINDELMRPFGTEAPSFIEWSSGPTHADLNGYTNKKSYIIYRLPHVLVDKKLAMVCHADCQNIKFQGCDFSATGIPNMAKFKNIRRIRIIGCMLGDVESGDVTDGYRKLGKK